ncbi:MAG: pseudaminic acid cytidylyltransferase [Halioglobus sp.]
MNKPLSAICIIPARGGSKRIPRKNIRPFRGKPILSWSIDAAVTSGAFDAVMVSTEDQEIADVARAAGAEVPFLRSAGASDDHATTSDVLLEVLSSLKETGRDFDLACCLYPTAPFVQPRILSEGRARLLDSDFDVMMPVTAFSYPIWRSLKRGNEGCMQMNFPENLNVRSQDLPQAYHDAGQWYWFFASRFLRDQVLLGARTGSLVLPATQVQDIDNEDDWVLAEIKHERIFG